MQDAVNRQFVAVILVDGTVDFRFASEQRLDLGAFWQNGADTVEADDIVDVGNCQGQALDLWVVVERQQVIALGHITRDQFERLRVDHRVLQIDTLFAQCLGERLAQCGFRNKAERDQQFADRLIELHLLKERNPQLIFGKNAFRNQDLAEGAVLRGSDTHGVQRGSGCSSARRFFTCARSNAAGRLLAASSASW